MRTAQNKKRSKAKSPEQVQKNEALIILAHQEFLDVAQAYLDKARQTLALLEQQGLADVLDLVKKSEIEGFMVHAVRQIDQTQRRVILGEVIPHDEKVFSIFQPHTEWISKGKAGVPVELGVKVCILEDQHQFILHHQVSLIEPGPFFYEATSWFGMFAPAATPPAVVARLNTAIVKVLAKPEVKKQINEQGAKVYSETPAQLAAFVQKESAKWSKVVKDSGASMD